MEAKKKVQKIRQHRNRTGGGSPCKVVLSEFEERIISIIGDEIADGNPALTEIGFGDIAIKNQATAVRNRVQMMPQNVIPSENSNSTINSVSFISRNMFDFS